MTRMSTTPRLSERDFQRQVTELAELRGWEWFHVRPGRTKDSWRTPTSGTMAAGWPDLVLVRARDGQVIYAELKQEQGKMTDRQLAVLGTLELAGARVYVWRPSNFNDIESVLR